MPHKQKKTIEMIDLQKFCAQDEDRPHLRLPWSRDGYTFATDGKILIRVAQRDDIPDNKDAPDCLRCLPDLGRPCTYRRWNIILPDPPEEAIACIHCFGSGKGHDCPSCSCECDWCCGTGCIEPAQREFHRKIHYDGRSFPLGYLRLISSLPDVDIEMKPDKNRNIKFSFSGGDGILSPYIEE